MISKIFLVLSQNCALSRIRFPPTCGTSFLPSTQGVLTSVTSTPEQQKLALVQPLNNILKGVLIFETVRFAGVKLSAETLELKLQNSQNPQGTDLIRLNRLLLEDAYTLEIAKSQEKRHNKAEPLFKRALEIWENTSAPATIELANCPNYLAMIEDKRKNRALAQQLYERALSIERETPRT